MKPWKLASAVTALVLSTSANAALVSADLNNVGDDLLTVDTNSGLEWLDLSQSEGSGQLKHIFQDCPKSITISASIKL